MTLADKLSRANKAFQRISNQHQIALKEIDKLKAKLESLRASMTTLSEDRQTLTKELASKKRELAAATKKPAATRKSRKTKEPIDNAS